MKNFVVTICAFALFVFAFSGSVMAEEYYTPGAVSTPQTVVSQKASDDVEEAGQLRDMMLAYSVVGLTQAVRALAEECKNPDSPDCGRAVVDADKLDKPAENPKAAKLTPAQRAQVSRMINKAIPMAAAGQVEGLNALADRVSSIEGRVDKLEAGHQDHEGRIVILESVVTGSGDGGEVSVDDAISISRRATVAQATANEAKALAEEAKATAEEAKANGGGGASQSDLVKVAEAAGDAQGRADVAGRKADEAKAIAEEALAKAEAKAEAGEPIDPTELAELRAKVDAAEEAVNEAEAEAKGAKKVAESAYALASQKQDLGLLEVGLVGQFSPAIMGMMLEGTYWIRKAKVRVGLSGAIGLALDDSPVEFMFDTRIKFGYEFHRYIWGGLYLATYGANMPFNDELGYGGGAFIRGVIPLTKELNLGIEGFIGPAYEYAWVTADPPEGLIPGATYDNQRLSGEFVPMGGVSVSLFF